MAKFDDNFKNELKSKISLVNYIGRFLRLEKSGSSFKACCPFHSEKTPSFHIKPEYYHCFGCGESGDLIKFVMKYESMDFLSAVKSLAEEANMEMPDMGYEKDVADAKRKKERLVSLMVTAGRKYIQNLKEDTGIAKKYLEQRGISGLANKFGIGLSKDFDDIIGFLKRNGYSEEEIIESSIGTRRQSGGLYDNFGGRLIFPIINNFGEVIAFGGRRLVDNDTAKYYNSRATVLFDKSKTIFGINLLKKKKQAERVVIPILVEGYMDVVSLHKAGFDTAVASMGTALTKSQARQLKSYANKVYISYDGDAAGQAATIKGLELLQDEGIEVLVVELPDGMDPDDAIRERGADFYQGLIDKAQPLIEFKLAAASRGIDMASSAGRAKYAKRAVESLSGYEPIVQEEYLKRLSAELGYTIEALRRQMNASYIAGEENAAAAETERKHTLSKDNKLLLLNALYKQRPYADPTIDMMGMLTDEREREAYYYFKECISQDRRPEVRAVLNYFADDPGRAAEIMDYGEGEEPQMLETRYKDYCRSSKLELLKTQRADLQEKYDLADTIQAKAAIAQKMSKIDRELRNGGTNE